MNIVSDLLHRISGMRLLKLTPARIILLGFILLILTGALLLYLPISSNEGKNVDLLDALFTSTSAVCVTGLVVVDTNVQWSYFGKAVILMLIQTGALGIMSLVTLFSVFTGKKLSLTGRMTIKESISNFTLDGIARTYKGLIAVTIVIEAIGSFVFSTILIPEYGFREGIIKSIFHSVSAFCNAGFDIFGAETDQFTSLLKFNNSILMLLTTCVLIIIGGLGFIVWNDIASKQKFSRYTLHSRVVLVTTLILIILGTLGFLIFEFDNHNTIGDMPLGTKLLNSFFQSVTSRTAGFNAIPMESMDEASNFLTILLMIIGGAPGSTAGGIKVTTISIIVLAVISFSKGRSEVQVFNRRVPADIIIKAITITSMGLFIVTSVTLLLIVNNSIPFLFALFEAASAFGTVGLSTGITSDLTVFSKYVLIFTMIIGRIGPFTAVIAFISKNSEKKITYKYPEGKITVG